MAKQINCECGFVVQGTTDEELLANAKAHIGQAHPDLAGKLSDDDVLAMAEEA